MRGSSWIATMFLLLSVVAIAASVNTSGYLAPESSPQFTFTLTPCTWCSVHFTFSTPTLPPAISITPTTILGTDWAITFVSLYPPAPNAGDQVVFSAGIVALWSTVAFPQNVRVGCFVDSTLVGGGIVNYPGPVGVLMTVSLQTPWTATFGTHKLTCGVATIPAGLDPNKANNVMSTTFTVGPAVQMTTQQVATSTQPIPDFTISANPPSQTVLQGQTASYSVNVSALNGFNSQVSLSVSGLPSGANGVFSDPSATPNFASILTVTLPTDVPTASYTLTITGSGGGLTHVANLVLTVNAAMLTQSSTSLTQTSSGLMSMIQQNPLLILGGIVLLAAVIIAVALLGRRKPTRTQPTRTPLTTRTVCCVKCENENPDAQQFCTKCGSKLHQV